jgi:hypothetical protein
MAVPPVKECWPCGCQIAVHPTGNWRDCSLRDPADVLREILTHESSWSMGDEQRRRGLRALKKIEARR